MRLLMLPVGIIMSISMSVVSAAEQFSIPMHDYGTGTYYVKAGVHNVSEGEFLVDTGSGYVVVDTDLIEALLEQDMAQYIKQVDLATANGEVVRASVYHLESMTIGQSCRIKNIDVVVLPNGGKCILGLSALSKAAPFTLSTEPPSLTLSNCLTV